MGRGPTNRDGAHGRKGPSVRVLGAGRETGPRFPNRGAKLAILIAVATLKSNANAALVLEAVAIRLAGLFGLFLFEFQ